jgi:hypothetical protein
MSARKPAEIRRISYRLAVRLTASYVHLPCIQLLITIVSRLSLASEIPHGVGFGPSPDQVAATSRLGNYLPKLLSK